MFTKAFTVVERLSYDGEAGSLMENYRLSGRVRGSKWRMDTQLADEKSHSEDGKEAEAPSPHPLEPYAKAFLILILTTLICGVLDRHVDLSNIIAPLYLLPVLMSAVFWGRGPAFFASVVSVLAFDYFFVHPAYTFIPSNPRDFVVLAIFLIVAAVTGTIATRLRQELEKTIDREKLVRLASAYNRNLIEINPDPFVTISPDGKITDLNGATERATGHTREELLGTDFSGYFSEPERARQACELALVEGVVHNYELRIRRKDGDVRPVLYNASVYRDETGNVIGVLAEARDIADLKETEDRLRRSSEQLRALSAHIQSVREEERTHLARDIHDDLGQALTGLKMDLSRLAKNPPADKKLLMEQIASMGTLVDDTIQVVRKISTQLRPGVLDDLGLVAAIEWQMEDFEKRTGIRCRFSSTLNDTRLDRDLSTAVFRILQEALTNVVRHSRARHVKVEVREDQGSVVLAIEDDGRGITDTEIQDPKSLGLLGIRERALLFGGEVQFRGVKGKGTTVVAKIPLTEDEETGNA